MTDRIPIAIIGGGVLGLSAAYALLQKGFKDIVLLEKNAGFGLEQSGSNSGVIHAGFLYPRASLMTRLCVEGAQMLYEFCRKHAVPHLKTGKLMVATDAAQEKTLEMYLRRALASGLQGAEIISGRDTSKREPCVQAKAALYIPQSGVFDPSFFVAALHKTAAGMHDTPDMLMKSCKVVGIEPKQDYFRLAVEQPPGTAQRWQIDCDVLINAAGLYSLDIAKTLDPDLPHEKQYLRGEYFQFNRSADRFVNMNVYRTPYLLRLPGGGAFFDLGAHLTPKVGPDERGKTVVARECLVGPLFSETGEPQDYRSSVDAVEFCKPVQPFFPNLRKADLYRGHTGILAMVKNQTDFMVQRDRRYPRCIHLLGMESPALTASLAIGKYVAAMIA